MPGEGNVEDPVASDLTVPCGVGRGAPLHVQAGRGQRQALHPFGGVLGSWTANWKHVNTVEDFYKTSPRARKNKRIKIEEQEIIWMEGRKERKDEIEERIKGEGEMKMDKGKGERKKE
jgi:hypothetical protein